MQIAAKEGGGGREEVLPSLGLARDSAVGREGGGKETALVPSREEARFREEWREISPESPAKQDKFAEILLCAVLVSCTS